MEISNQGPLAFELEAEHLVGSLSVTLGYIYADCTLTKHSSSRQSGS